MKTFSEIANYLLRKGMSNERKKLLKELEGRFIVDPNPVTEKQIKDLLNWRPSGG